MIRRATLAGAALAVLVPGTGAGAPPSAPGLVPSDGPAAVPAAVPDTVVRVRRGDRLLVRDVEGDLEIVATTGDELRVSDLEDPDDPVRLRGDDGRWTLRARGHGRELRVEVPGWLPVEVDGRDLDVRARGLGGGLAVVTIDGEIDVADASGELRIRSVDGEIRVSNVSGSVVVGTVDEDVWVRDARGSLTVSSTGGDLTLEGIDAETVSASTAGGDIRFAGRLRPGGRYTLGTHSGDVVAEVARDASATVRVSTFGGTFEADFPVTLDGFRSGRETRFTLGTGDATVELESFDGDIVVRRRGGDTDR